MDRAEAIKRLTMCLDCTDCLTCAEHDMAIAALREQEQREQGCFVCDGWVGISKDNFCPNCGRKLGGADRE